MTTLPIIPITMCPRRSQQAGRRRIVVNYITLSFSFAVLIGLCSLSSAEKPAIPLALLSLEQAILQGQNVRNSLQSQHRLIERAKLTTASIKARYSTDVSIQLRGNKGETRSNSELNNADNGYQTSNSATLSLALPWWHKAELKYDQNISEIGEKLALSQYSSAKNKQDKDIYVAYFETVFRHHLLQIQESYVTTSKTRLNDAKKDFDLGRGSKWRLLNEESNYLSKVSAYQDAETELFSGLTKISALTGLPVSATTTLTDTLAFTNELSDIEAALDSRPNSKTTLAIEQLELQLKQKQLEVVKVRKTAWRPKITVYARYIDEELDATLDNQESARTIFGASVNVPIPNRGEMKHSRAELHHDIESLKNDISVSKSSWENSIGRARGRFHLLQRQLATHQQLIQKKKEEVEAATHSYKLGRLNTLELQNFENLQLESQQNHFETLLNMHKTYAELCALLGRALISGG
ncbi:MAG: outer membrane protein TolC [Lentisphaeria bacterium]